MEFLTHVKNPKGKRRDVQSPAFRPSRVLGRLKKRLFCFADWNSMGMEFLTHVKNPKGEQRDVQSPAFRPSRVLGRLKKRLFYWVNTKGCGIG